MEMNILKLNLTVESDLNNSDAEKIRGYLGNLFWDNSYAHQHKSDGSLIYRYPRVQYKVIDGSCLLLGFEEGSDIVKKIFHDLNAINFSGKWKEILSKGLKRYTASFSISSEQREYQFLTAWLALNEENYERYKNSNQWEQIQLLKKILIGNILSMAKGLEYAVTEEIKVESLKLKMENMKVKDIKMIGFIGDFEVNFNLPDYIGLGKMVSKGFGTIKKTNEKQEI